MQLNSGAYHIVLASQSPRRRQLLSDLGYNFTQRSKEVDESFPADMEVTKVAEYLSRKKAKAYRNEIKGGELLITSDTTVCINNKILNKPNDAKHAIEMLQELSGEKHHVVSGVCLSSIDKTTSFSVSTTVYMKNLSQNEIEHYVKLYKPFDKAGAYGIQEWIGFIGVEKIEGSFYNVMGLPVKELYEAIKRFTH